MKCVQRQLEADMLLRLFRGQDLPVSSRPICGHTTLRPVSVIQAFQTAPKGGRQSPCRVMTEMSGKLAKGYQGTERQTRLLTFKRERSF
jgi:hypothetical protein